MCVDVSDLQDASYLPVFVIYPAACSLIEAGLQLSISSQLYFIGFCNKTSVKLSELALM